MKKKIQVDFRTKTLVGLRRDKKLFINNVNQDSRDCFLSFMGIFNGQTEESDT
jgi:hypothetical protein